jgi:anion-transporting  ArsA/GET3 family ATPase
VRWTDLFDREIVIVSGKGGVGKSTIAAALATLAARTGRRALLVEVEGRDEVAGTLGVSDPGFRELPVPQGFSVLSITPEPAALEYLRLYVGLQRVSRTLIRSGILEQLIGAAPGFRDLLTCGKLYELTEVRRIDRRDRGRPIYDVVIVDAPPTGQLASFLSAPRTFAELIRVGRMKRQAGSIDRMLRERSHVLLVTILEEMAVAETIEALGSIDAAGVPVAAVAANRYLDPVVPRGARGGLRVVDGPALVRTGARAGLTLTERDGEALVEQAVAADRRRRLQTTFLSAVRDAAPSLLLPEVLAPAAPDRVNVLAHEMAGDAAETARSMRPGKVRSKAARSLPQRGGLAAHLADARIVVVCGSGGVGKTTISAAIAVRLAEDGHRTALLTVDPARRLATALRLPTTAGERTEVPIGRRRSLVAIQLDTQRTFDDLVRHHAGSDERRDRILANPFYRRIADTLSGTHEYMAMEKLYELASETDLDAIVIDTPPTRSALSFLDAPRRLTDFLGGRLLRWLLWPTAGVGRLGIGVTRMAASAFARGLGGLIGVEVLGDAVEFLAAFESMFGGFKRRAAEVTALLGSPQARFVVVTAPTPTSLGEASFFVTRLMDGNMRLAAVVANRWRPPLPAPVLEREQVAAVQWLDAGEPVDRAAEGILRWASGQAPLAEVEAGAVDEFAARHGDVSILAVPQLGGDVHDVQGLRRVAKELF